MLKFDGNYILISTLPLNLADEVEWGGRWFQFLRDIPGIKRRNKNSRIHAKKKRAAIIFVTNKMIKFIQRGSGGSNLQSRIGERDRKREESKINL